MWATIVVAAAAATAQPPPKADFDVVVYGASCAGVAAAVAAGQLGMRVALFEPLPMIGGMCAAGNLALHDSGPAGGLGAVYARLNAEYYNVSKPVSQPESFVSEKSLNTMLANASVSHVKLDCHLTGAQRQVTGGVSRVKSISVVCEPSPVTATVFVDASYDGDIMCVPHVPARAACR
jgi:ribulose 1,5-bisphosphate synthetase/thiazole synthase